MTPTDAIRWTWTFLTGWGVLFALWNLREVLVDNWAISQVRTTRGRPMDVLKLQTRGAVFDQAFILVALGSDFIAGVCALVGQSIGALVALILSAAALILLSFSQTSRRRRLFRVLRLKPPKEAPP